MEPTLPFLADERVRMLRRDAEGLRAGRARRRLLRQRRTHR
jgi:hypothetical protein